LSVTSMSKQLFIIILATLWSQVVLSADSNDWQDLATFKHESQEVTFKYSPSELKIKMKADKGGYFSKEYRDLFSVGTKESLNSALQNIQDFLLEKRFSAEFYPKIEMRLSQFHNLSVAECQALHMPLAQPLSQNSLEGLIHEVQRLDAAMRAPAQSVQSIKIREIELDGEKVDLHLSLDSQDSPTSVGLVKTTGNFKSLKLSSDGKTYSLYNAKDEWVIDISLASNVDEQKDSQNIKIKLTRPSSWPSLTEIDQEMLILNSEGESWHSSFGIEGVGPETFQFDVETIFHEYGVAPDSFEYSRDFKQWYESCKIYESQLQLISVDQSYFCQELTPVQISYFNALSALNGDVAKKAFRERYRSCLREENVLDDDGHKFVIPPKPVEQMVFIGGACKEKTMLPYSRDVIVSTLLQDSLVREYLNSDDLKEQFSNTIHEKAFAFCTSQEHPLESKECKMKINKTKNKFLMKAKVSRLIDQSKSEIDFESLKADSLDSWSSCQKNSSLKYCSEVLLIELSHVLSQSAEFNFQNSHDFRISLNQFEDWRASFESDFQSCLEKELKESQGIEQLMSHYELTFEDCRERASLNLYPKWYREHLSDVFSRFSESRPLLWKEFIETAVDELQEMLNNGEFAYKAQLEERLPEIILSHIAEGMSSYLKSHIKTDVLSPTQLKHLKEIYGHSPDQEVKWKEFFKVSLQDRSESETKTLLNDFFLNLKKSELRSVSDNSDINENDKIFINESVNKCLDVSPNKTQSNLGNLSNNCRKEIFAQELVFTAKKYFEKMVSYYFPLTGEVANKILSPVWYMNRCKDDLPRSGLSHEEYLARVEVCIDLAKMDIYELVMTELIAKNQSLMSAKGETLAMAHVNSCLPKIFLDMEEQANDSELKRIILGEADEKDTRKLSLYELQQQRFKTPFRTPFLSRMFAEEHMGGSQSRLTAIRMRNYIAAMQDKPEFRKEWMQNKLNSCLDETQQMINNALRESFIQHSDHYRYTVVNSQGETDVEVLRHILDDELIELVLEMKDQRGGSQVSPEITFEALSRAQQVISQKLAQGFIFDRDALKIELIIFKSQLKDGLRWMNASVQDVSINELGSFFESSELANILAYAEMSSMVYDRFSSFLLDMKDKELSAFEYQVGHRPDSRLSEAEKKAKSEILDRFERLESLAYEMTSSYDFRRITQQNASKGRELLSVLKEHFLIAQITGREARPWSYERAWELMGELIIEDRTPGGFAERFVGEMAQSHLDQRKDNKWGLTKFVFYEDEDFDWDELRKTSSGRKALNYYTRYILLPKVMGREVSGYLEKLRRSEFERYLARAQEEN